MSTTHELPDAEVIELEPTLQLDLASVVGGESQAGGRGGVAILEGPMASLAGEVHDLRRSRLGAASLFLTVVIGVLFCWFYVFGEKFDHWLIVTSLGLRFLIAAGVAAAMRSPSVLTRGQVRGAEFLLFGGLTALMAVSQYQGNLDLLRAADIPGVIALTKNGVLGVVILMVILGMLIPNDVKTTATVSLSMALALEISLVLVMEHPEVAGSVELLRKSEHVGSNILFLMIGAGLAIYGSFLLNGLRTELHAAKKYGQYQLIRKLGEGGMGEVHLAEHQLLKRPCALKLIKPTLGAGATMDPIALARFEREVRSAARLEHPNTIEIFDYGHTDDGTFYYVMEYLRGDSLADIVRKHGTLPPGRVTYLFRQVCAGLAEAHRLGLVHRDLKPANLFVAVRGGESDVAKVLDFGLVKLTKEPESVALTAELTVSGTPHYMSPEQAVADSSLDTRADIYALGAMMYYALTGRPPFEGESAFAVMMAHARDPVVPPSQIRPEVPEDLERVVLRCLAKKADERYQDVKALGRALAECAAGHDWDPEKANDWWKGIGVNVE